MICSTILQDLEAMKHTIGTCQEKETEVRDHLAALEKEREAKCEALESIKKEILSVEEKMKGCDDAITDLQAKAKQEENTIASR